MIYFRLCFSFSCSGYDLTLIKKSHTLNFYLFFLLLVNVVAQFTAKTTNSEKAIYFLSLKSHLLFTGKSFTKILCFPINVEKNICSSKWRGAALPPPPLSTALILQNWRSYVFVGLFFWGNVSMSTIWIFTKMIFQVYLGSRGKSHRVMINSSISRGKSHSVNVCGGK